MDAAHQVQHAARLRTASRATPSYAALRAFFDRRLRGLGANGRSCADCHMATDHFQLSPASVEARFRFLQLRRRWDPDADDPLFRPIDADDFRTNGENATDFSNLRKNGLIQDRLHAAAEHQAHRSRRPINPRARRSSTCGAWFRPSTTCADRTRRRQPLAAGPERRPADISWMRRMATLQEQALGALINHAQSPERCRRNSCSTIWRRFSACCSRTIVCAQLSDAVRAGTRLCPIRIRR